MRRDNGGKTTQPNTADGSTLQPSQDEDSDEGSVEGIKLSEEKQSDSHKVGMLGLVSSEEDEELVKGPRFSFMGQGFDKFNILEFVTNQEPKGPNHEPSK